MAKKYLRIKIEGQDSYLKAFENSDKPQASSPDFSGPGVRVWVNVTKNGDDGIVDEVGGASESEEA